MKTRQGLDEDAQPDITRALELGFERDRLLNEIERLKSELLLQIAYTLPRCVLLRDSFTAVSSYIQGIGARISF